MATLQAFDDLLDKTVHASRLSATKVKQLSELAIQLVANDHHIATALLRVHSSQPPASQYRISGLYVFDAIARAAKASVVKGIGRHVSTELGKGTQAGLLAKMEGIVDSIVEGMIDDGHGRVWPEGRDKTRKIIEIWRKGGTFPDSCISQLSARITAAGTPSATTSRPASPGMVNGGSRTVRSTTPPYPPPAHMLARVRSSSGTRTNSPGVAPAPAAPGQLPPEIASLLGVKSKEEKAAEEKAQTSLAIDALIANVRGSTVSGSSFETPPAPVAAPPPAPGPAPAPVGLDPAQLAALANLNLPNLVNLSGLKPASAQPELSKAPAPAQSGASTSGLGANNREARDDDDRDRGYANGERYQRERGDHVARARSCSPQRSWRGGAGDDGPRDREPYGNNRRNSRDRDRGWGRNGGDRDRDTSGADEWNYERRDSRDRRDYGGPGPSGGTRDFERRDSYPRHDSRDRDGNRSGPPPPPGHGPGPRLPNRPTEAGLPPRPSGLPSAPPTLPNRPTNERDPHGREHVVNTDRGDRREDGPGYGQSGRGHGQGQGYPARDNGQRASPPSSGSNQIQPPTNIHGQGNANPANPGKMPTQAQSNHAHADEGSGSAPTDATTLATFDISSFNPMLPECWAQLGQAFYRSTGREPGQLELMQFLATGQVPAGGMMGMMPGMGGMGGGSMGGMGGMSGMSGMSGMGGMGGMGMPMGMGGMSMNYADNGDEHTANIPGSNGNGNGTGNGTENGDGDRTQAFNAFPAGMMGLGMGLGDRE